VLSEADEQRIVRAVAEAERGSRGEVRVHLERRCPGGDALARAAVLYRASRLHTTRDDTGVLLYVARRSRCAAVWSGAGIHPRADAAFWQGVTDAVAKGYRDGSPIDGICRALGVIGDLLRAHVGGGDSAGNEIPDGVTTGDG
jgi:uncharacterized membrane protein